MHAAPQPTHWRWSRYGSASHASRACDGTPAAGSRGSWSDTRPAYEEGRTDSDPQHVHVRAELYLELGPALFDELERGLEAPALHEPAALHPGFS
jgi:hypothetical protein